MLSSRALSTLCARLRDQHGVAVVITLMAMALVMALAMALVLTTITETNLAAHYMRGVEALYAADAAVERVMPDMLAAADWSSILEGASRSSFVDGAPAGGRTLGDGSAIDLTEETNLVRCGKPAACSDGEMAAAPPERPWGANNPRWQLYGFGMLQDMLPVPTIGSRVYVIVWVADDPAENDDNPLVDGNPPATGGTAADNPGHGVLAVLACAYGPGGVRRLVQVTLARDAVGDPEEIRNGGGRPVIRLLSWREVR